MPRMPRSVDLPAPDGPMIVRNSPSRISRFTLRRTYVRPAFVSNHFSIFRRLTIMAIQSQEWVVAHPNVCGSVLQWQWNNSAVLMIAQNAFPHNGIETETAAGLGSSAAARGTDIPDYGISYWIWNVTGICIQIGTILPMFSAGEKRIVAATFRAAASSASKPLVLAT